MDWTERAAEYIRGREYRYLSPVIVVRRTDKRMVALHSVALTNDPAIVGVKPIVNKGSFTQEDGMDTKKVREVLGLRADATDEEVLSAIVGLRESWVNLMETLGLRADASPEEARGAVLALKNPSGYVSVAEFAALKERLDRREAEDLVEAALKADKVTPANRDWALSYALKDRAGFKHF